MYKINIKPMSINRRSTVVKGRIRKTEEWKKYMKFVVLQLPRSSYFDCLEGQMKLDIVFGFSNRGADIDNPVKPFMDCLQSKYGFNDNQIYSLDVKKEIVKKGDEFIKFQLEAI